MQDCKTTVGLYTVFFSHIADKEPYPLPAVKVRLGITYKIF